MHPTLRPVRIIVLAAALAGLHAAALAQQSLAGDLQSRIGGLFSKPKADELIEPELAFRIKVSVAGPTALTAELIPAEGYYLYRDRIRFGVKEAPGVTIKRVDLPPGKVKNDPNFGRMETYDRPIQAAITLNRAGGGSSGGARKMILTASYQGCHQTTGVCYPPIDKEVSLFLP